MSLVSFYHTNSSYESRLYDPLLNAGATSLSTLDGVAFKYNDGVSSTLGGVWIADDIAKQVDYVVVTDDDGEDMDYFVLRSFRNARNVWTFSLRRNVLKNCWDYSEPHMIHRGFPKVANDVSIIQPDNVSFNRIKTSETLIKDKTGMAWLIGYVAKNFPEEAKTVEAKANLEEEAGQIAFTAGWPYCTANANGVFNRTPQNLSRLSYVFYAVVTIPPYPGMSAQSIYYRVAVDTAYGVRTKQVSVSEINALGLSSSQMAEARGGYSILQGGLNEIPKNLVQGQTPSFTGIISASTYATILTENGKQYSADGGYVYQVNSVLTSDDFALGEWKDIYDGYKIVDTGTQNKDAIISAMSSTFLSVSRSLKCWFVQTGSQLKINAEPISIMAAMNLPAPANRVRAVDAAYDMIALPYPENPTDMGGARVRKETSLAIATEMISSGYAMDFQLLPYFPIQGSAGDLKYDTPNVVPITQNGGTVGWCWWCPYTSFTFDIDSQKYGVSGGTAEMQPYRQKIAFETIMRRLVAPNGSTFFEFKDLLIAGKARWSGFNVDCNYKPYQPYIHVNPHFTAQGYFGGDFNDYRGLVVKGDFSVTQINDAWKNYQLQNKNYQAIFDRETQNIEYNHTWDNVAKAISIPVNAISSGTSSAMTATAMTANPIVGAAVGAASTAASVAGGVADYFIEQAKYNEKMSYRSDMFNLNLGNIQALPANVSKISAFDGNNKIFPYLERYDSTDQERDSYITKVIYQGISVERIANPLEFASINVDGNAYGMPVLLVCEPLYLEQIPVIANAIRDELLRGVRINIQEALR